MKSFVKKVKFLLAADKKVAESNKLGEWRLQAGITLITVLAYIWMSLINLLQRSQVMLIMTGSTAMLLAISYVLTRKQKKTMVARILYIGINAFMLTLFLLSGGNDGFAALWLIIAPFVAMFMVDLKLGFSLSLYFVPILFLVLDGPLKILLRYNYNHMFCVRFPFLYIISFSLALFIAIRGRLFQYELLKKQEELEKFSSTDMATGLLNRNRYNDFSNTFANQDGDCVSVIFTDVNGLHRLNNEEGHEAGDRMLKRIAEMFLDSFGPENVYRMGGDEILVIAVNRTESELNSVMKKITYELSLEKYSISYGIRSANGEVNLRELVKGADQKMLENKDKYYRENHIEHR